LAWPVSHEELEAIRAHIESFESINLIEEEMYHLVAKRWPHLLLKIRRTAA
jgi:hypothetical protein